MSPDLPLQQPIGLAFVVSPPTNQAGVVRCCFILSFLFPILNSFSLPFFPFFFLVSFLFPYLVFFFPLQFFSLPFVSDDGAFKIGSIQRLAELPQRATQQLVIHLLHCRGWLYIRSDRLICRSSQRQ